MKTDQFVRYISLAVLFGVMGIAIIYKLVDIQVFPQKEALAELNRAHEVILRNLRDPKEGSDMRVDLALQGPRSRALLASPSRVSTEIVMSLRSFSSGPALPPRMSPMLSSNPSKTVR